MPDQRMRCPHCKGFTWWSWDDHWNALACCGCGRPTRTDRAGKRRVLIRVDGREVERYV
jgi:hypothetical protein